MPLNVSYAGTFTSNTSLPVTGIPLNGPARLILRSSGSNSTWGGGTVHLLIRALDGSYQRTGQSWASGVAEVLDIAGQTPSEIKLEMVGATSPDLGFEVIT